MPALNMAVPHRLTQDEALTRVKTLLGEVKAQFADKVTNLREDWSGNVGTFSFKASGFAVSGTLTVNASEVKLDGSLPFAAAMFKGKIVNTLRERAETLLA